MINAMIASC